MEKIVVTCRAGAIDTPMSLGPISYPRQGTTPTSQSEQANGLAGKALDPVGDHSSQGGPRPKGDSHETTPIQDGVNSTVHLAEFEILLHEFQADVAGFTLRVGGLEKLVKAIERCITESNQRMDDYHHRITILEKLSHVSADVTPPTVPDALNNAKDDLENYCSMICNIMEAKKSKDKSLGGIKDTIERAVQETREWLARNPLAEKDDYKEEQKRLADIVKPLLKPLIQYEPAGEKKHTGGPPHPGRLQMRVPKRRPSPNPFQKMEALVGPESRRAGGGSSRGRARCSPPRLVGPG